MSVICLPKEFVGVLFDGDAGLQVGDVCLGCCQILRQLLYRH